MLSEESSYIVQRVYYSERGAAPNSIVVANAKIAKPRTSDPTKMDKWDENSPCVFISTLFRINTPQKTEVNKVYTIAQNKNILVAKSDLSTLHLFDITHTTPTNSQNQRPSATLMGHEPEACESNFALDTCSKQPWVLSGDKNGVILLWDIEANIRGGPGPAEVGVLKRFEGHSETVEDVCFKPHSASEFCSVGDDQMLLFWDARAKSTPVQEAPKWCTVDLHCVDWNAAQDDLLVTGDANGATFVFDRRKIKGPNGEASPLHSLHHHEEGVYRVGWLPNSTKHFASGGEDSSLFVWDLSRIGTASADAMQVEGHGSAPPEIICKHSGHRGSVQDLQWNPLLPWVMGSVSEDASWAMGGGTMQIWRPLDLLYRSDGESVAEIEKLQNDMKGALPE